MYNISESIQILPGFLTLNLEVAKIFFNFHIVGLIFTAFYQFLLKFLNHYTVNELLVYFIYIILVSTSQMSPIWNYHILNLSVYCNMAEGAQALCFLRLKKWIALFVSGKLVYIGGVRETKDPLNPTPFPQNFLSIIKKFS